MPSPAAYLACPHCGCTSFEERTSQLTTVEFTLATIEKDGKQSLELVKDSGDSKDDDNLYFCRNYCGFESYNIEDDAALSEELVEA